MYVYLLFSLFAGTEDAEEFLFFEGDHFRSAVKPSVSAKTDVAGAPKRKGKYVFCTSLRI